MTQENLSDNLPDVSRRPEDEAVERPQPEGHIITKSEQGSGIAHLLKPDEGYIVGRLENELLRLKTDAHLISVAPTGAGKGRGVVIPNLLDHPGSAFVLDIRGETLERTVRHRMMLGQEIVVLDPFDVTGGEWGIDCYNPFETLDPKDRFFENKVRNLATALMFDPEGRSSNEPIWDNVTRVMLEGAITLIATEFEKERRNLRSLNLFFSMNKEEEKDAIQALYSIIYDRGTEFEVLRKLYRYLTDSKSETKLTENAIGQINSVIGWAGDRSFSDMLESSSFSFSDMQAGNMTVYVIIPEDSIDYCAVWIRLLFESALSSLNNVNKRFGKSSSELEQKERVLFMLDEVPAFGKLDAVAKRMATVRGRGANLWLILQHISQLDKVYGEHDAKQIIGNAAVFQAFESNEMHELEYLSKVIGNQLFDVKTVNITKTRNEGGSVTETKTKSLANTTQESEGQSGSETDTHTRNRNQTTQESRTQNYQETTTENINYQSSKGTSSSRSGNTTRTKNSNWSKGAGTNNTRGTNESRNKEYDLLDYAGIDLPMNWEGRNLGESIQKGGSRNWGRGGGKSFSRASGWQEGSNQNESVGVGIAKAQTKGGSDTQGTSYSEGESDAKSEMKGWNKNKTTGSTVTDTDAEALGKNWSEGETYGLSIKPEERPIETSRSLRQRLSRGNQLLVLRGHFPFISSRMDYISAITDSDVYRFPAQVIMSGIESPQGAWQRAAGDFEPYDEFKESDLNFRDSGREEESADLNELKTFAENMISEAERAFQLAEVLFDADDYLIELMERCRAGYAFSLNANRICGGLPDQHFQELETALLSILTLFEEVNESRESYLPSEESMQLDALRAFCNGDNDAPPTMEDTKWLLRLNEEEMKRLLEYCKVNGSAVLAVIASSEKFLSLIADSLSEMVVGFEEALMIQTKRNNDRRSKSLYG